MAGAQDGPDEGGETKESTVSGIRMISPVTDKNLDTVLNGLYERGSLRELTAEESNTLMTAVPSGTYFYVYGFQFTKETSAADFIVSRERGTDWHHFEVHKRADGEPVLIGFATVKDAGKFEYYSKRYGPTPKLVARPVDDFNVLMILPLRLLGEVTHQDDRFGTVDVTVLNAALLPKQ